jgi:hypothetical protein
VEFDGAGWQFLSPVAYLMDPACLYQCDVHMSPFVLYPRMSRISFLACLRVPKLPAFELALRLEPIVQLAAGLFAAFEIDCVCATSDFLITHRFPY